MNVKFTKEEAEHAQLVVKELLLNHRFFIKTECDDYYKFKYCFDKILFVELLEKQKELFEIYKNVRNEAEERILYFEERFGFISPKISDNSLLVQCNKYGAGSDIKSVFPLSFFLDGLTFSKEEIFQNILSTKMNHESEDNLSPNQINEVTVQLY